MELYTIIFGFREGDSEFMLQTDFIIKAEDEGLAFEVAKDMESELSASITPYFKRDKRKINVEIEENRYFKNAEVSSFRELKRNENGFVVDAETLSNEDFLQNLEKKNERPHFEYVSYGIKELL